MGGIAAIPFGLWLLIIDADDSGELGFALILLGTGTVWRGARLVARRGLATPDPTDEDHGSLLYNSMRHPPAWKFAQQRVDIPVVTVREAREQLGVRTKYTVNLWATFGRLEPCWNDAGAPCVTQASVDLEKRWWRESTRSDRAKRRLTQWFAIAASG